MVAHWHGTGTHAARASGSVTSRCRQSRDRSPAAMAAFQRLKKSRKHLRSVFDSATLSADVYGVEISRTSGNSRRHRFDSPLDHGKPRSQPTQAFRETLRNLAMETGQRRVAHDGLPWLIAHV